MNPVYVLDLDDTIFPEAEYRRSGLLATLKVLKEVGFYLDGKFVDEIDFNDYDLDLVSLVFSNLCVRYGTPFCSSLKRTLIEIYRVHSPTLSLHRKRLKRLTELAKCGRLFILSDGDSIRQRLKLAALGLSEIPALISGDYINDSKLSTRRYEMIIRQSSSDATFIFAGNDSRKDFYIPNRLGWITYRSDEYHPYHSLNEEYSARIAIEKLEDILWLY